MEGKVTTQHPQSHIWWEIEDKCHADDEILRCELHHSFCSITVNLLTCFQRQSGILTEKKAVKATAFKYKMLSVFSLSNVLSCGLCPAVPQPLEKLRGEIMFTRSEQG